MPQLVSQKNVKTFPVIMCLASLRDQWNGTTQTVNKYKLLDYHFFLSEFFSPTFTIHITAGEGVGYLSNSSLPFPPASHIIKY